MAIAFTSVSILLPRCLCSAVCASLYFVSTMGSMRNSLQIGTCNHDPLVAFRYTPSLLFSAFYFIVFGQALNLFNSVPNFGGWERTRQIFRMKFFSKYFLSIQCKFNCSI